MPTPYLTTREEVAYKEAWARYEALHSAELAAHGTPAFARLREMTDTAWTAVNHASIVALPGNTTTEKRLLAQRL